MSLLFHEDATAQNSKQMVRLAQLQIDSTQLENYKVALKEEIETSLRIEPGVLTLYAVAEKNNPTHITILEIYANEEAYKKHLQTSQPAGARIRLRNINNLGMHILPRHKFLATFIELN